MSIENKSWRQKIGGYPKILAVLFFVALYFFLIWMGSEIVDDRALRKILEEQASYMIGADVRIETLNTELKYSGGWRIRLRNISIENTSPDFAEELFACRKLVFEGSFYDLLYRKWSPRILLKDWQLIASSNESGKFNLSDLCQPRGGSPEAWDGWPFTSILKGKQNFVLQNGKIILTRGITGETVSQTGSLNGSGTFTPNPENNNPGGELKLRVREESNPNTTGTKFSAEYKITDLNPGKHLSGKWGLILQFNNQPLSVITSVTNLPEVPKNARLEHCRIHLQGYFEKTTLTNLRKGEMQLSGLKIPALGINSSFFLNLSTSNSANVTRQKETKYANITFNLKSTDTQKTASLTAKKTSGSSKYNISGKTSFLDFSQIPAKLQENSWEKLLLGNLGTAELEADEFRILNIKIKSVLSKATLQEAKIISLDTRGKLAGGEVTILANNWQSGSIAWPEQLAVALHNADALNLSQQLSLLLPDTIRLTPSEGKITLFLAYPTYNSLLKKLPESKALSSFSNKAKQSKASWQALVQIEEELRFDDAGNNRLLQALWQIPGKLLQTEANCLGLKAKIPDKLPSLGLLRLDSGKFSLLKSKAKPDIQISAELSCRELGQISLKNNAGVKQTNSFRLLIKPFADSRKEALRELKLPQFNPEFKLLAKRFIQKHGLEIQLNYNKSRLRVKEIYLDKLYTAGKNFKH